MSSDHVPPPPPDTKEKRMTFAERREAELRARTENNRSTKQQYRIRTQAPNNLRRPDSSTRKPMPDTGGLVTRDMPPVKLRLGVRQAGAPADVIPIRRIDPTTCGHPRIAISASGATCRECGETRPSYRDWGLE